MEEVIAPKLPIEVLEDNDETALNSTPALPCEARVANTWLERIFHMSNSCGVWRQSGIMKVAVCGSQTNRRG